MIIKSGLENNDGRQDIILKEDGKELMIIRQEFYSPYMSYEQIKNPEELAKFLASIGLCIAIKLKDSKNE